MGLPLDSSWELIHTKGSCSAFFLDFFWDVAFLKIMGIYWKEKIKKKKLDCG